MVRCLVCEKKFKNKRGLSIHLVRTHDIRGQHGRLSLKIIKQFFPLLTKKRWKKAKGILERIRKTIIIDEWIRGYLHALNGMIISLKESDSRHESYIIKIKNYDKKKLTEMKGKFSTFSTKLINNKNFDMGYFHAWIDFSQYKLTNQ